MARFLHRNEDFRVLHAPYSALLHEYYGRRGPELVRAHGYPAALEEWATQRGALRRRLIEALGLVPELVVAPAGERGDLRARTVGHLDRRADGYRVELVEFQSSPRVYVSAALYLPAHLPEGRRVPAVLSPHGHWATGKHTRHIQIRSVNLARRGFAVLVVDTMGQAERTFMGHRHLAAHALFYAGHSTAGLQVWDNLRGMDYLAGRPEVDATRIGVTGASGGGNHTMYLTAVDERVAASVPVCSVEMLETYFDKSACVCETVPDLLTFADKPHLLGLLAPRPLLIMNAMRDRGFSTLSARRAFDYTQRIYGLYDGGLERLAIAEANAEHSYDRTMRERTYAWFSRWLQGLSPGEAEAQAVETDTWVEAEESDALRVWGPGGAGRVPDDAFTVNTLYAALAPKAASESAAATESAPASSAAAGSLKPVAAGPQPGDPATLRHRLVTEVFGGWPERTPLSIDVVDTIQRTDCTIELLVYWSEPGVPVPALLFVPSPRPAGRIPAVLYTSPSGKGRAPELRAVHEVLRAGAAVLAIDYRGQGETAGTGESEGEGPAVARGIMVHRPLFGGRVWDVVRGVEYLSNRPEIDPGAIFVWGEADASLLALHAAALDESISGAACLGLPDSYRIDPGGEVTLAPWLVLPGVLALADVADVRALVSPRACVVGDVTESATLVSRLIRPTT